MADWKDYSTGIFLRRQMGRLAQYDIRVFAVAGNHDAANRMTKSLEPPENMKIFSSAKVESVRLERPGAVVHGRSFASRHVDENLAIGFGPAEKGLFNVGVLHTSLDGRVGHGVYAPCTLDDLRSKGYQYWALGHVHNQEIVAEEPFVVFPGCVQGRHIREAGPKGCVLFSAAVGTDNLREVLADMQKRAGEIFKPRGTTTLLNRAVADYKEARKRVKEATLPVAEWKGLLKNLSETDAAIKGIEKEIEARSRVKSRLERLGRVTGPLGQRRAVLEKIEALGPVDLLPEDFEERRKNGSAGLRDARARNERLLAKLQRLR